MIAKDYTVSYWQDLFAARTSLPWPRVAAWMTVESAGYPQALGTRYEVGIVQVDLQDGPRYGGTTDTLHTNFCSSATSQTRTRDLTDDEENLQVDVANTYISQLYAQSLAQAPTWSDDDVWCLVKLHHALPALAGQAFSYASSQGQTADWDTFREYVESLPADTFPGWGPRYTPWSRFFDNAEKVGKLGLSGLFDQGGFVDVDTLLVLAFIAGVAWYFTR